MSRTPQSTARSSRSRKSKTTTDAVVILENLIKDDPKTRELADEATVNAIVAKLIFEARTEADLTQAQLADLVGTQQPVIARLEDSDYEGHSLTMLQRIAKALDRRLEIRLAPFDLDEWPKVLRFKPAGKVAHKTK
jgi:ribosome-binding protein aMBF1 (putative translation factor)